MNNVRQELVNWLKAEFRAEQKSDFTVLRQVPDTRVIRFLDHYTSLDSAAQAALLEILVDWSSYGLIEPPPNPVWQQYSNAVTLPGIGTGVRYTGVNLLAGLMKDASHNGLEDFYRKQGVTGLAMILPKELISDLSMIIPVRIPTLRRMVKSAFTRLFSAEISDLGSEILRYEGELNECRIRVQIRYSARMGRPQLEYGTEVHGKGRSIRTPSLCFESLLGVGFGRWDYITEENAERSVQLLAELVQWVARLPDRLPSDLTLNT